MRNSVREVSHQREKRMLSPKHAEFIACQLCGVFDVSRATRACQEREGVIDGVLEREGAGEVT
jgi:hypothetical protein